jgi:FdhD protein
MRANDKVGKPPERENTLVDPEIADQLGVKPVEYVSVGVNHLTKIDGEIVDEVQLCISVNGQELATLMCSPNHPEQLAVGFLLNEGLISSLEDVRTIHLSKNDTCLDIWLQDIDVELPKRGIITAGCGGGITFDDLSQQHQPLSSDLRATPAQLAGLMRKTHLGAELYQRARGIHTAALAVDGTILGQVEDVGRHNCLDRLAGKALLENVQTEDCILLSSGRVSSEMINKARKMQIPIVCSRTSPTSLSVALAETWNITIVAYLRQNRMRIYTHDYRILYS